MTQSRSRVLGALLVFSLLACTSCGTAVNAATAGSSGASPASVTDQTRASDPLTGFVNIQDFERVIFVRSTQDVTNIGRANNVQKRAFVSATMYYDPPLAVQSVARYVGADSNAAFDLVAMRCQPSVPSKTQAVLATWPNVFKAVIADLGTLYTPSACPASPGDAVDKKVYCNALSFSDPPNTKAPLALAAMMDAGSATFQLTGAPSPTGSTTGADVFYDLYGIGYAFSGLGFSVKDSYLAGQNVPLTSAQMMEQSVVPEYLVANVTLAEGGCKCIRVKPYAGRDQGLLDWGRVLRVGSGSACTVLNQLP
ncbi:MAG: hypothetical protein LAP21_03705 [Acidobacteriia bacterium]|nr:hypothetical protein [Terriglobia bacterium]